MTLCLSHLCFINIYNFIMNIYILFNAFMVLLRLWYYCVYGITAFMVLLRLWYYCVYAGVNDNPDVFTTPLL